MNINKNEFQELIQTVGMSRYRMDLERIASSGITVSSCPHIAKDNLPIGKSKLGGLPDLPPGISWPKKDGVLLEFVGQFCLEDLVPYDLETKLPSTGMLSFFFDGMLTDYDTGVAKDRCKVIYSPQVNQLMRLEIPKHAPYLFNEYRACQVNYESFISLPSFYEIDVNGFFPTVYPLDFSSNDMKCYKQLWNQLMKPANWLLGHPWPDSELHYEIVHKLDTKGRYAYKDYHFKNEKKLIEEMKGWKLLFQVSSDHNAEMSWGDGGNVYFWIRESDLKERNFDNVEAIMKCS